VAVVGGQNIARQVRALGAGVDILVATPGRLNDLLQRNQVSLNSVEVLVLDEADRMLDMGFLPQVRRIVEHLPRKRQTLLLSATVSRGVEKLAREMMSEPVRVEVGRKATTVATLFQSAYSVLAHAKTPLLLRLLDHHRDGSFLVFTETRRGAERVAQVLAANRHRVDAIHADRSQSQRNRALAGFKDGRLKVLVATNVAARGIDIDDVSHVINYDVPSTIEDYLHRVGRTARAGREGSALTLVSPAEESAFAEIERAAGISITRARLEGFSDGRTEQQTRLATEIGRLRGSHSRSFSPRRASR
jgi:ATP-dependent RNA helicase RhlE